MKQRRMKFSMYTPAQKEWIGINMKAMGDKYVSREIIEQCTEAFNDQFQTNRSVTAIAAQFRLAKTKLKLPVRIAFTSLSNSTKPGKVFSADINLPAKITDRIPVMLRELDAAFKDLIRQNDEMRSELRKLADVRSAIDKYRNGR
jgi:ribosomal protein S17E